MSVVDEQPPLTDPGEPEGPGDGPADDEGDGGGPWWHSWWRLAVLGAALVFLGAAAGYAVTSRSTAPGTGSVDVGFLQDMRAHHDQAVQMAWIYAQKPAADQDKLLRQVAGEILFGQQFENGVMAGKLRAWGQPEANETGTVMGWMGMPVPIDRMPGLATQDQLRQLAAATGRDADVLFTELMIAHHEGGIHMASVAAKDASDADVRTLAGSMASSQQGEVDELSTILGRL